jgi:predicted HTH domain antitoxin
MEAIKYVPKTTLARQTRQVMQDVRQGQAVVVEHHGEPEAAIIDILDYHLLRAALHYYAHPVQVAAEGGLSEDAVKALLSRQEQVTLIMSHYLAENISLGRAAELLGVPWLSLRTRCLRLDIPLRIGPTTREELEEDVANAARFASPNA